MMGIKKRLAALAAAAGTGMLLLTGAYAPVVSAEETIVYEGYDTERMENVLAEFESAVGTKDNADEVRKCYENIINESDYLSMQMALAQIQYSQNMTEENYNACTYLTTVAMNADSMIASSLYKALKSSSYRSLMEELLDEGYIMQIEEGAYTVTEETEAIAAKKNELLKRYLDCAYSDSLSDEEKNLECAEIYLETVKLYNSLITAEGYNYLDYAYYTYCRDYTPDDIAEIGDAAAEAVYNAYIRIAGYASTLYREGAYNITFDNNMDVIEQFSYKISDELKESAKQVQEMGLYRVGTGTGAEQKSYTTLLSYYDTAIIYQYLYGNTTDFSSTAHEFGHLNAMRLNCIPVSYIHSHSLDLAEVQSQGLEVLYTKFYDTIFGKCSDLLRANQAISLLSAVAAGFQGNEFEYYVFENADTLTPEQVAEKYSELSSKYKIYNVPLYRVPHFFQYPGYYISYGVSALAALNLWEVMYRDFDEASEMYTALSHVSVYDGTGFSAALESAGFDNILGEEFLSSGLSDLTEIIISGKAYGDIDENGIVNTADFLALINGIINSEEIINENNLRVYDVSNDGKVTAADVVRFTRIVLK